MDILNIVIMVLVGAVSGTLAARVIGGTNYGFVINALLGIAGAVVGSFIFNLLKIEAGSNIVKGISNTFNVNLPQNFIGMLVAAFVGAIIILLVAKLVKGGVKKSR